MRVAYISSSLIPSRKAHSIQIMKMCEAMVQEGHEISLIIRAYKPGVGVERISNLWAHYGIQNPFPIIRLSANGIVSKVEFELRAIRHAQSQAVDLIYARNTLIAALSSMVGIPTCLELHQLPGGQFGPWYFRTALVGPGFRKLVVITKGLLEFLKEAHNRSLRRREIVIAPDGVDLERYEDLPPPSAAARQLGADSDRFRVGYTGNLYEGRGIGMIFQLAKALPHVEFWIVGGDTLAVARWRSKVEHAKVQNLQLWGFVPNRDLPLYQAACHVLLMPSARKIAPSGNRGDISAVTSPMKMFEYMATGRLIIASDLPVLREVLNERNALLCAPEDFSAWLKALRTAEEEVSLRQTIGVRALQDVRQYSWQNRVRKILG
jgi:glycosyltransferase involved in cell wall biosynthesis